MHGLWVLSHLDHKCRLCMAEVPLCAALLFLLPLLPRQASMKKADYSFACFEFIAPKISGPSPAFTL